MNCCVIWQRALEKARADWLYLTGREHLLAHNLLKQGGNTSSFNSIRALVGLEL